MNGFNPGDMIRRAKHESNYVTILNDTVRDERLSWKARGLHHYILSLPDTWEINIVHLSKQSKKDGVDSVKSALKELETYGYIAKTRTRDIHNRFERCLWYVYETPQVGFPQVDSLPSAEPQVDFPSVGLPSVDNPLLRITKEEVTKEEELLNTEQPTFSTSPRAAESETPTTYSWVNPPLEPNPPSIENQSKRNPTISVQAQQLPTAQPQNEVKPSQPPPTPITYSTTQQSQPTLSPYNADHQLPLSQKKEKAEIVGSSTKSKESPPSHAAPPPLSTKGKGKKNMLSAEQEATFLAIYLAERASNMVEHQSVPQGANKHLFDLTQKYPDNYYDVVRFGMISLREREDDWWRDQKKSFTLVNIMTDGKMQGHYETHVLDMKRNPGYVRRVEGLAPSKDKGRQQMSVLDEAGNPVSNEVAQMVETVQSNDLVRRLSNLKKKDPEWYR